MAKGERNSDRPDLKMSSEEITAFLNEYQFMAVASLQKDGSPNVIPLGYVFDGEYVYLSIGAGRLPSRVKRDPRTCVTCFNNQWPERFVVFHGTAKLMMCTQQHNSDSSWNGT